MAKINLQARYREYLDAIGVRLSLLRDHELIFTKSDDSSGKEALDKVKSVVNLETEW